ncbi:MAG: LolA family protein [Alphaproteobacteria bacterium]
MYKRLLIIGGLLAITPMPATAQATNNVENIGYHDKSTIAPTLSTEQTAILSRVEEYLNGIKVAKARFSQQARSQTSSNATKSAATGIFYLQRPDKMRFQYEKPNKDYILADGNIVYYWDSALKQQSNAPQGMTLADFFLRPHISFGGDILVMNVEEKDKVIGITIAQLNQEDQGKMTLFLSDSPLQLHGWQVIDPAGGITDVVLEKPELNISLDSELFIYRDPNFGKNRR